MSDKKYFSIEPARFKLDGGAMFGIIPKPLWNKVHSADEENRIDLALRLLLIIDEKYKRKILIDTGIGDYHHEKFNQMFDVRGAKSPLINALQSISFKPEDITDVVISHLHFDHVGGLGEIKNQKMSPIFTNATLHLHRSHYEYSKNPSKRDSGSFHKDSFLPLIHWYQENNKLNLLDGTEGNILPSLNFKSSMGHTPYLIHPYDEKFIYLADLIPTSNHIHIPWVMGYDMQPGVTCENKEEILNFALANNLIAFYEHDPIYYGSTIIRNEKGLVICDKKFEIKNQNAFQI